MEMPQDVIDHCNARPLCKGCPLGTCTAPLVNYGDERWSEWVAGRVEVVREITGEGDD